MNAKPGTPEGVMLDKLLSLVEAYENKHSPMEERDKTSFYQ